MIIVMIMVLSMVLSIVRMLLLDVLLWVSVSQTSAASFQQDVGSYLLPRR